RPARTGQEAASGQKGVREMNEYPDVVARIAEDYLGRVKSQLGSIPAGEKDEFLKEIRSHLYEACRESAAGGDVTRILGVLRNVGGASEAVSERLRGSMISSGAKRKLPLYIVGGLLTACFGIPLGFGGVAVLVGILIRLAGVVAAYYAAMAASF